MDYFKKGYSGLLGPSGQPQSAVETVDKYCERVSNATLIEDRRAAVLGLKSMSREYQLDVGTKGMSALVQVLKNDRDDVEIIPAALEALINICTVHKKSPDSEELGVMFTEIFIKDPDNVSVLLELLEIYDFHVRFHTIHLLNLLLANKSQQLQDAILASPQGVSKLVDLLSDKRESIRNDGLLLLIALTTNNQEIQKIVAFENAFDLLFHIILEEGGSDGGIVVSDCLQLIQNLIRGNTSNQTYFRETGCPSKIASVFNRDQGSEGGAAQKEWDIHQSHNSVALLELIRILLSPKATQTHLQSNQTALINAGVLLQVIKQAFGDFIPGRVKLEAFLTVADLIRGHENGQSIFAKSKAMSQGQGKSVPQSALIHVVHIAVSHQFELTLRMAALATFTAYLSKQADAQLSIASTLSPPGPVERDASIGSLIFTSLFDLATSKKDPYGAWFAANILSHIINGNQRCKELLLNTELNMGDLQGNFLAILSHNLQTAEDLDVRVILGYLSLMVVLLHGSSSAVSALMGEGSNLQYLIEQINQSKILPLVQSLSALVFGLALQFNDDSNPSLGRITLQDIIVKRIGADLFTAKLDILKDSDYIKSVSDLNYILSRSNSQSPPSLLLDASFVASFKDMIKPVSDIALADLAVLDAEKTKQAEAARIVETSDSIVTSYKQVIREQDSEILSLKASVKFLEAQNQLKEREGGGSGDGGRNSPANSVIEDLQRKLAEQAAEISNLKADVRAHETLRQEHETLKQEHETLTQEHDDLLVLLSEQDYKMKTLKSSLRKLNQPVSDDEDDDE